MMNLSILFFFLVSLKSTLPTNATKSIAPAIYVFGDSTADAGNNNFLNTKAKSNFFPFGIDLKGLPKGRCTNGKTHADLIAEYLGLPLPPPYLGLKNEEKKTTSKTGINYASSGSGVLYGSGKIGGENLALEEQIDLFASTVKEALPSQFPKEKDLQAHLSKSIFLISLYGNDYVMNYFLFPNMSAAYTPKAFAEYLVGEYAKKLQKLHQLGARKFLLTELGAFNCSPTLDFKTNCNETKPGAINLFNELFEPKMKSLESELSGSTFTRIQLFNFVNDLKANAAKYGFKKDGESCCELTQFGGCIPNKAPCAKREEFVTFDRVHPSQATYEYMTKMCIDGSICKPLSLKMLVDA